MAGMDHPISDRMVDQTALLRIFLKRLVGGDAAEDLSQESMARLSMARCDAEPGNSFLLFHIAKNLARNHKARLAVRRRYIVEMPDGFEPVSPQASPERVLEDRQELHRLAQALERLPPRRKAMFVMARVHGLSHKEIASRLGVKPQSVEKQIALAIADLTVYLQDQPVADRTPVKRGKASPR